MTIDRRTVLAVPALVALRPAVAFAQDADGFRIDWQGGPQTPAVARSLAAQVALVRSLKIKPPAAAFFASQVITVDLAPDTHTRAGPRGVFFERSAVPPENPVLLHELLHRYHLLQLPQGWQNAEIVAFYDAAKAAGRFPAEAYMFTRAIEFFAMTASVVLWGKAARPPRTREKVRERLPGLYAWIVREFEFSV